MGRPELCGNCRGGHNCDGRACVDEQAAYDAGVADVEARIDAAIKKHADFNRTGLAAHLRKRRGKLSAAELVLLDVLDPETNP